MIKNIIFFIGFLVFSVSHASNIRSDFHNGMFEEDKLEDISDATSYPNSNLVLAYKGVCKTMLADYAYFPTSKLSYFNDGKAEVEKAITKQPNNPELRYLRLLVQLKAPFFLGYNSNIDGDINIFVKHLPKYNLSKYWKLKFIENLIGTEELTTFQKTKIINLKKTING